MDSSVSKLRYTYNLLLLHFNVPLSAAANVYHTMMYKTPTQFLIENWMYNHDVIWVNEGDQMFIMYFTKRSNIQKGQFDIRFFPHKFRFMENHFKIEITILVNGNSILLEHCKRQTPPTYTRFNVNYYQRNLVFYQHPEITHYEHISEREFYYQIVKLMEFFIQM